jgi:hypothetical protein
MTLNISPNFFKHRSIIPSAPVIQDFNQECLDFTTATDQDRIDAIGKIHNHTDPRVAKLRINSGNFRTFFSNFFQNNKYTSISEFFQKVKQEFLKRIEQITSIEKFYISVAEFLSRNKGLLDESTKSFVDSYTPSLLAEPKK